MCLFLNLTLYAPLQLDHLFQFAPNMQLNVDYLDNSMLRAQMRVLNLSIKK